MLNATGSRRTSSSTKGTPAKPTITQRVVIVNGNPQTLDLFETALDASHYDVVFIESTEYAYSQIKGLQPDLVILCVHLEDMDGFQVLSMLKLDEDTRRIPVLTCATECDNPDANEKGPEVSGPEMFTKSADLMN